MWERHVESSWLSPIDAYCERVDPSFWAEPLNAVTNLAFLIAALAALFYWTRRGKGDPASLVLIAFVVAIGIGSFLYHTVPNGITVLADVIPIALFIYVYFFFAMRRFLSLSVLVSLLITIAFLIASFAIAGMLPPGFLNGSGPYLPTWTAILLVGLIVLRIDPVTGRRLLLACLVLAVSLTFRSIDMAICPAVPIGSHMMWHILNGVMFYIVLTAMIDATGRGRAAEAP